MNKITYSVWIIDDGELLQAEYPPLGTLGEIRPFSVHFCEYLRIFKMRLAPQKKEWKSSETGNWILPSSLTIKYQYPGHENNSAA